MSEPNEQAAKPTVVTSKATIVSTPIVYDSVTLDRGVTEPHSAPVQEVQWPPGTILAARYQIAGLLGAGGMGAVYQADDLKLEHPVALKFLSQRVIDDPLRLRGLYDEVRIGRQISHPNCCRIYDIVETTVDAARVAFLCMELIEGESLEALLRRSGGLKGAHGLQVAQQLCSGLQAVHDQELLHRDLKPPNVMIDRRGVVRLMDFGVAALARDVESGQIVGTPGYLSPEALEGQTVTIRSEIYALGIVLYEIFTGKPLFMAATVDEQRTELKALDLSAVSTAMDKIDPSARRAVLQCLRIDPAQRPATAAEVAELLNEGANRRLRIRTLVLSLLLTVIAVAGDAAGWTVGLEHVLYDWRTRHCQYFVRPPSDRIIHCEIDDAALEEIGHWPWPRSQVAEILDEVSLAGAKVIGMDVLFSEPVPPRGVQKNDGSWEKVDDDAILAEAMRRAGNVMAPVNIPPGADQADSPLRSYVVDLLLRNPEQSEDQLAAELSATYSPEEVDGQFPFALREAISTRLENVIATLPAGQLPTYDDMRERLLPHSYSTGVRSYADDALKKALPHVLAVRELDRFTSLMNPRMPTPLRGQVQSAMAPNLAAAARYCGCVSYLPSADGVVRNVPLVIQYGNRWAAQSGLALACAYMGVDAQSLRLEPNRIIIPRPGQRDEIIPTHSVSDAQGQLAYFLQVPWQGTSKWQTAYDYPAHRSVRQRLPILRVWDVCEVQQRIEDNNQLAYGDVECVLQHLDLDKMKTFQKSAPDFDDVPGWNKVMNTAFNSVDPDDRAYLLNENAQLTTEDERTYAVALRNLQRRPTTNDELAAEHDRLRAGLRKIISGKAVLIGSIASSEGDQWRTPLHENCPGEMILGTVFSAIVTNDFLRVAPDWVNLMVVLGMALAATAAVTWLSPRRSLVVVILLAGAYAFVNAEMLFDRDHVVLEAAGPLLAIAAIWLIGSMNRILATAAPKATAIGAAILFGRELPGMRRSTS